MDETMALNHKYSVIGRGVLFIWWGIVILVDPLTIGMGAIGTGLIILGTNIARFREGIRDFPTRRSNNIIAVIAIVWGSLDVGRQALGWDWGVSLAMFLIVVGVVSVGSLVFPAGKENIAESG